MSADPTISELQAALKAERNRTDETLAALDEEIRQKLDLRANLAGRVNELDASLETVDRLMTLAGLASTEGRGTVEDWRSLGRGDAVERALYSEGPMGLQAIIRVLHERGRDDEYHHVSAILAHLKRSKRVHSRTRGLWVAGPDPSEEQRPASISIEELDALNAGHEDEEDCEEEPEGWWWQEANKPDPQDDYDETYEPTEEEVQADAADAEA